VLPEWSSCIRPVSSAADQQSTQPQARQDGSPVLSLRVPPELRARLDALALRDGLDRSAVARRAIELGLSQEVAAS
jgi:hypothetical protein